MKSQLPVSKQLPLATKTTGSLSQPKLITNQIPVEHQAPEIIKPEFISRGLNCCGH